jgi:hypothetical protein
VAQFVLGSVGMGVKTLPSVVAEDRETGVICPECGGAIVVRTEGGRGYLSFHCRVGHAFALHGMVEAKEQRLEERMWGVVMALEELAGLLSDVRALDGDYTAGWVDPQARIERLRASAAAVREVIERNRPLDLGVDEAPDERAR